MMNVSELCCLSDRHELKLGRSRGSSWKRYEAKTSIHPSVQFEAISPLFAGILSFDWSLSVTKACHLVNHSKVKKNI